MSSVRLLSCIATAYTILYAPLTEKLGRRRKKSCIPRPETPGACTECFARGVQCHEQEASQPVVQPFRDSKQDLQRRVTELENALLKVASRLDGTPSITEAENGAAQTLTQLRTDLFPPTPASSASIPSPGGHFESAPIFSLFDNSILSRRPNSSDTYGGNPNDLQHGLVEVRPRSASLDKIRQTLLALFPSQQRVKIILDASHAWWGAWQYLFPEIFGAERTASINEFVAECMSSGSVQKISKALLCIAIGLQETSVVLDAKYSETATQDYAEHYPGVIDDLVLTKDDLAGTIDGIECLVLQAKHDANIGHVRRSWVTFRRAISFAQLQGLHVRANDGSMVNNMRRDSLWNLLYQSDRFNSLLLGLPHCISEPTPKKCLNNSVGSNPTGSGFLFRLANVVGHIIDRNQEASPNNALTVTVKIEGELIDLAATMTADWWAPDPSAFRDTPSQLYTHYLPQFWHHQARTLLHLPFMLKATTDRRYEYNRIAALESARQMLGLYQIIRLAAGFMSLICKVIDFQAFTAAMVLVLDMLGPKYDMKESALNRSCVSSTTEILQKASMEAGGGVARQAARALELFGNEQKLQGASKIAVPYFGTVSFGPGQNFARSAHSQTIQPNQPNQQPLQVPTPSEDSLDFSPEQWSVDYNFASMPFDFDVGPNSIQEPQDFGINPDLSANVNVEIDQDWTWFWNNTKIF